MTKWIVSIVKSFSQFLIKRNYEVYFSDLVKVKEFFVPHCKVGSKIIMPLSNYLFIEIEEESIDKLEVWRRYESLIRYFLKYRVENLKGEYMTIPHKEMEEFKKKSDIYMKERFLKVPEAVKGKMVYIKSGIFAGLIGVIKDVEKKGTVKVYVDKFNCIICIPKDQVEIIDF